MAQSPSKSPLFAAHRVAIAATDTTETDSSKGMNFTGKEFGIFNVRPSGGANPTVKIQAWDATTGAFVDILDAEANPTAHGANLAYQFTVRAAGRILFAHITLAGGAVSIDVANWDSQGGM